ncbi:DUF1190 domain-containing protein [Caulobacter segnis]|uniref:DUF1190 domain-containing protein n=1 Tax=Caulobacter segnis TaxID=88688 RepID=UPI00240FE8C6|nr:DUF1190 domain-containing protein [Caulobacter segnis]MDG2520555.1 DUF1190 domain-containing protein [Caulobacter segnis]
MKRSSTLRLTTVMASASLMATACGPRVNPGAVAEWETTEAAPRRYTTVEQCLVDPGAEEAACRQAHEQAVRADLENGSRYWDRKSCEEVHGDRQCLERQASGGSYFAPLLTGFVIGQMLDGRYGGTPVYRYRSETRRTEEEQGGGGSGGGGGYYGYGAGGSSAEERRAYADGQRSTARSRGGFGLRAGSFGG